MSFTIRRGKFSAIAVGAITVGSFVLLANPMGIAVRAIAGACAIKGVVFGVETMFKLWNNEDVHIGNSDSDCEGSNEDNENTTNDIGTCQVKLGDKFNVRIRNFNWPTINNGGWTAGDEDGTIMTWEYARNWIKSQLDRNRGTRLDYTIVPTVVNREDIRQWKEKNYQLDAYHYYDYIPEIANMDIQSDIFVDGEKLMKC